MEAIKTYLDDQPAWKSLVEGLEVPQECNDNDTEDVGWFASPEQHLVELIFFTITGITLVLAIRPKLLASGPKDTKKSAGVHGADLPIPGFLLRSAELVIAILLILSFITVVVHKQLKGNLWFLLQPCHVIHFLTIILALLPDNSSRARAIGSTIFNYLLCYYFAPILGLLFADLTCYQLFWELENWFLQHALLCLVPFFWLSTRKFVIVGGMAYYLYAWSVLFIYHMAILTPLGLWSHSNLNFTICPPGVLKLSGLAFRWVASFLMLGLLLLLRGGLIGFICRVLGISQSTGQLTSWGGVEISLNQSFSKSESLKKKKPKKSRKVKAESAADSQRDTKSS